MKKTLSIILAFLMIVASVPVGITANATDATTITFENTQAAPGKEFDVDLNLTNNPGLVTAGINLSFDEGLTLVGATNGNAFPASIQLIPPPQLSTVGKITGSCNFAWSGTDIADSDIKDGVILTLRFKVSDDADIGAKYNVTVSSRESDCIDKNLNPISIAEYTGVVEVVNVSATTITFENAQAAPGKEFEIDLNLSNNPGLVSAGINLSFDEGLTLVGATNGDAFPASIQLIPPPQLSTVGKITGSCNFAWSGTDIADSDIRDGVLLTLRFLVSDNAEIGDTYGIRVSSRPSDCIDKDLNPIDIAEYTGVVEIKEEPKPLPNALSDFTYELTTDGIVITGYAGTKEDVIIADSYEIDGVTYDVIRIDQDSFYEKEITSVVIPETVQAIGDGAFFECRSLMSITILGKNTEIGEEALAYYQYSRRETRVVEGVTIYGYTGSTAEVYAGENEIAFVALSEEHIHNYEASVTKEPTCAEKGIKTFTCTACGDIYTEEVALNPNNHADYGTKVVNAKAATCKEDGYTGDTVCAGCEAVLESGSVISKETVDHTWDNGEVTKDATCKEQGEKTYTCTVCGTTKTVPIEIDPTNHVGYETETRGYVAATCEVDGYTGDVYCLGCGNKIGNGAVINKLDHDWGDWTDNGENHIRTCQREGCGKTETADHVWNNGEVTKAATCKEEGVKTFTCIVCGATKTEPIAINSDNHADYGTKVVNAKAAICEDAGYTGDTVCLGCEAVLEAGTVIDKLGHDFGAWTDNGENHIRSCQREDCGATETADHVWNNGEVTKAATCKEEGVKTFTCIVCGATKTEPIAINSDNHADYGTKVVNAKEATCEDAGYTGDTVCLGCKAVLEAGTVIDKLGHDFGAWTDNGENHTRTCQREGCDKTETADHIWNNGELTKDATCKEQGEKTYTCTVCGTTKTEPIAINPDNHADYGTKVINAKAATCEEAGYTGDTVCLGCEAVLEAGTVIDPLDHDWSAWSDNGENHIRTCQREGCDATETADHIWNDGEVTKASTCKEEGVKTFTCTVCGAIKTETIEIDPSNHADYGTKVINAKAATCKEDGYTGDTVCAGCEALIKAGSVISKDTIAHTPGEAVRENVVAATCKDKGNYDEVICCTVCEAEISREKKDIEIDPSNHADYGTKVINAKAATCKEDGYTGDTVCAGCEAVFEAGSMISKDTIAHTPGEATRENEVAETCKDKGSYDEVIRCTVCEAEISREKKDIEIDPSNHADYGTKVINAKAATCKEDGYTGDTVCAGCEAVFEAGSVISKETVEHTWNDGEPTKAATCKEQGEAIFTCTVCGKTKTGTIAIDPTNHADYGTSLTGKKDATCTAKGYTGDKVCNGCGNVVEKGFEIGMIPHNYVDSGIKQDEDGTAYRSYICSVCGAEKKEAYTDKLEDAVTALKEAKKLLEDEKLDESEKAELQEKIDALEDFLSDYVSFDENGNVVSGDLPYDNEETMGTYRTLLEDLSKTAAKYAKAGSFFEALIIFVGQAKDRDSDQSFYSALVELIKWAIITIVKLINYVKGL